MIVNFTRWRLVAVGLLSLLMLLVAPARPARADDGDAAAVRAQRLEHMLGYLAVDYRGAVSNGVVSNADEHKEHLALAVEAEHIAQQLSAPPGIADRVAYVRALVARVAPESEIAASVEDLRTAIISAYRLAEAPSAPPNPAHGRDLFEEHCATCHGASGRADTARAASLTPHPANFLDPAIGEPLSPYLVANTIRFGINGTAMIPFTFLNDADRWDIAFYVMGLRHVGASATDAPAYAMSELARRSDAELRGELRAAGVPEERIELMLVDLRRRAPFEDPSRHQTLAIARAKLDIARVAIGRGERERARGAVLDSYLEGVEPVETALTNADASLVRDLEHAYMALRTEIDGGAPPQEITGSIAATLRQITRAERVLADVEMRRGFWAALLQSAAILLREGVEAALLVAALLGIVSQAGLGDKKRSVHLGWLSAIALGVVTWLVSRRLVAISGAGREVVEGVTSLLATCVLFYVSYSLVAQREVARWMNFLRQRITAKRAAISVFGVAFLAAYREAFETVLFYQSVLASNAPATAVLAGIGVGAALLAVLVLVYTRAGRFAPPRIFFRVSSYLLYALAIVFIGQGIAALQVAGIAPMHLVRAPTWPALGVHPTLESLAGQLTLVVLALVAAFVNRRQRTLPTSPRVPRMA